MMRKILNHPWTFWALLSIPSAALMIGLATGQASYKEALHPTGEFSARMMVVAMTATPLVMLFNGAGWTLWLLRRRRYLGVAAFGYAFLHVVFYLADKGLGPAWQEALEASIWTGWVAFFIFVPLAITSNDWSVRKLGRSWKPLQRFVYPAALLTLLHWAWVQDEIPPIVVTFAPLLALESYRLYRLWRPKPRDLAARQTSP